MPESFPYRAKAFFAFEEIDGVDVCFFGVHVQVSCFLLLLLSTDAVSIHNISYNNPLYYRNMAPMLHIPISGESICLTSTRFISSDRDIFVLLYTTRY